VRFGEHGLEGVANVSITVRPTILPVAVFIIVEIVLVAETISVILLKEMGPRNTGAAPIAMLLSVALLANLGLVCGVAAAVASDSVRRSKRARARALITSLAAVTVPAARRESADLSSPACGAFPRGGPARPTESGDALWAAAPAMPASG
jgi:hypothetical protein